jgi:hypothetical protein
MMARIHIGSFGKHGTSERHGENSSERHAIAIPLIPSESLLTKHRWKLQLNFLDLSSERLNCPYRIVGYLNCD